LSEEFEIEILLLEKNEFYQINNKIKKVYLSDFTGKEKGIIKLLYIPILAWKLKKYIQQKNIKNLQSHIFRANYINILAKIFGAKHYTQIVNHGLVSVYKNKGLLGKINILLFRFLYSKADVIIWVSNLMKYDAYKIKKLSNKQVVIHNPVDIDSINLMSKEKIDNFIFDANKKYIISVGRFVSLKRQEDLIKALNYLDKNIEIIFLGDGELKTKINNFAKKYNLDERIHFMGNVKNPYKYISRADILVHTSEVESFGNVIIEALACNTPVISSDCGGPREILAPESDYDKKLEFFDDIEIAKYGILYPTGNIEKLVKAINLLFKNKNLYNYYKTNAKIRIKDFYLNKIVSKYKEVLNEKNSNLS